MKQKKITRKVKISASKANVIQLKPEVQTQPEEVEQSIPQFIKPQEEVKMPEEAKKEEPKVEEPKVEAPGWFSRNIKTIAGVAAGIVIGITAAAIYITTGEKISVPNIMPDTDQV